MEKVSQSAPTVEFEQVIAGLRLGRSREERSSNHRWRRRDQRDQDLRHLHQCFEKNYASGYINMALAVLRWKAPESIGNLFLIFLTKINDCQINKLITRYTIH